MCFSASASFTAGALLLATGVVTLSMAAQVRERPYAAIPLLFGIQQLIEGFVWLSFHWGSAGATLWLAQAYSFFSHVLWPVYVPAAAWLLERPGPKRRVLGGVSAGALAVGGYLLYGLMADPIRVSAIGGHIAYDAPHLYAPVVMLFYLVATTGSLVISSHAWVRVFGLLVFASSVAAYVFYARWFISVWCFLAAVLSILVVLHFVPRRWRATPVRLLGIPLMHVKGHTPRAAYADGILHQRAPPP